jgi:hypothetical protein
MSLVAEHLPVSAETDLLHYLVMLPGSFSNLKFDSDWLEISTGVSKFVIVPLHISLEDCGLWDLAGMELQVPGCGTQVAAVSKCVTLC